MKVGDIAWIIPLAIGSGVRKKKVLGTKTREYRGRHGYLSMKLGKEEVLRIRGVDGSTAIILGFALRCFDTYLKPVAVFASPNTTSFSNLSFIEKIMYRAGLLKMAWRYPNLINTIVSLSDMEVDEELMVVDGEKYLTPDCLVECPSRYFLYARSKPPVLFYVGMR